jgi:hypothetical protein
MKKYEKIPVTVIDLNCNTILAAFKYIIKIHQVSLLLVAEARVFILCQHLAETYSNQE